MHCVTRFVVVASFLAFAELGLSVAQAAEQDRLPTRNKPRIRSKAKINGGIRFTTASGGTGCRRIGGSIGAWPMERLRFWDFHFAAPDGVVAAGRNGSADGSRAANGSEIRPFYGHSVSDLDRRPLEANNETGPFYGRALPSDILGGWRAPLHPPLLRARCLVRG